MSDRTDRNKPVITGLKYIKAIKKLNYDSYLGFDGNNLDLVKIQLGKL